MSPKISTQTPQNPHINRSGLRFGFWSIWHGALPSPRSGRPPGPAVSCTIRTSDQVDWAWVLAAFAAEATPHLGSEEQLRPVAIRAVQRWRGGRGGRGERTGQGGFGGCFFWGDLEA